MITCSEFIFDDHLLYDLIAIYNYQIFCRFSDGFVKEFFICHIENYRPKAHYDHQRLFSGP